MQCSFVLFVAAQHLISWDCIVWLLQVKEPDTSFPHSFMDIASWMLLPSTLNLELMKLVCRDSPNLLKEVHPAAAEGSSGSHVHSCKQTKIPKQTIPAVGLWPASCSQPSLASVKLPALDSSLPIQSVIYPILFQQIPFLLKLAIVSFSLLSRTSI